MTQIILVVDCGSSSVRCTAYDALNLTNSVIKPTSLLHEMSKEGTLHAKDVKKKVEDVIKQCIIQLNEALGTFSIFKLGFTCFAMSWVGVDKNGEAVTPCYTVRFD